ncbi:MAG: RIP metalloprotease RseP [Alphaproteobacteria bacterium]
MIDFVIGTLIPFLFVLTVLVFVHEMGHYLIARWNGVRVETFSVGFGPELFGRTDRRGTRWRFSALPLGGYVKMLGGEQSLTPNKDEPLSPETLAHLDRIGITPAQYAFESFPSKRLGQRAAIVAGGPVANFLLAAVLFAGLFMIVGEPTTEPIAGTVDEGSAAAEAGLQPGDRIVEVDGTTIATFEQLRRIIGLNRGTPLELLIQRDDRQLTVSATPRLLETVDPLGNPTTMAQLGIRQSVAPVAPLDPFTAVVRGVEETYDLSVMTVQAVAQIVSGSRGTEDVGGVVRIAEMSGQVADLGFISLIHFMAILSISLGLINLVPIPVLDGGHLLFYAIEAVRGRPLGRRAVEVAMSFGLVVILGLFITTTVLDLMRFDGIVAFFSDLTG